MHSQMKKKYLSPQTKVIPFKASPVMVIASGEPKSFYYDPDDDDDYDPNA